MITIRVCTTIAASPELVWAAVERIESHIEWMQDAESITFRSAQHEGSARSSTASRASDPCTPRTVSSSRCGSRARRWGSRTAVRSPAKANSGCTPWGDGATQFCWEERLRFPWWLGSVAGEQAGKPVLRRLWQGNLARLKAQIERK